VMEFLPLMLQVALLLLGCALSRYIWEINITVASIIVGVTSFGVIFYILLVAAGAASEDCPYQTPWSHGLRHLGRGVLFSAASGSDEETSASDLRCISWMITTSLDKDVRLSTLKYLTTKVGLIDINPALIADCFNVFVGCINSIGPHAVVVRGLDQLAMASALVLFRTVSHLLVVNPNSPVIQDLRQQHIKAFPVDPDFHVVWFHRIMSTVHRSFISSWAFPHQGGDYKPSIDEHTIASHNLVGLALCEYDWSYQSKVPRWMLRFALQSLSLDPPPPAPIVADCLSIVAVDLGCGVLDTRTTTSDERYAWIWRMNIILF